MKQKKNAPKNLTEQMTQMKQESYSVFPGSYFDGEKDLSGMSDVLNVAHVLGGNASQIGTSHDNYGKVGGVAPSFAGGFTSSGNEVPVEKVGSPEKGYIAWGVNNQLPNLIAMANGMLPYTSTALKFNIDTACGLGIAPMYRYFTTAGGATKEEFIPYASAGAMLRQKILDLKTKLFALTKDHDNVPQYVVNPVGGVMTESNLEAEEAAKGRRSSDGLYFKRMADDFLEDIIGDINKEISRLQNDLGKWERTQKEVKKFLDRTDTNKLLLAMFTDLIQFGIFFPEIQLSQNGTDKDNRLWKPKIVSVDCNSALKCRLEKQDEEGVSRFVYLCNKWINPTDPSQTEEKIDALPALNPVHPLHDLKRILVDFRLSCAGDEARAADVSLRPTRLIYPISYPTAGRVYYPQPAYWSIFNDVYQFAANIIRDRAIRKANENMFGRIVYVHSEYLEKLTLQLNAKRTDEEKQRIKDEEIKKIKQFLSNKNNNGQTFAACTFTGADGKDHDAFKVETIPYSIKNVAEADKTEIADASGIIMFAMECHPDLIGSVPGGSSSKGGTYQREMLQIKQAKMSPVQNLVIKFFDFAGTFNDWDSHLKWHITQRTLTTLDRNHSGQEDA